MSILASLCRAYERMLERGAVPPFGYTRVVVGFCVVLSDDGKPAFAPIDLRQDSGRRKVGPRLNLPAPLVQRTSGITPNFLWDKTAYSLGVTAGSEKRTREEHKAFVDFHGGILAESADEGLSIFARFLGQWSPQAFDVLGWPKDMKDENVVFALESEYRNRYLHERPAADVLWQKRFVSEAASDSTCLVTGERGRTARSHPPIKGVWGAQSSGAFIVSYNVSAFESYGHREGDNAPVSEPAAFAYTAALNRFLEKDSPNRIQVGDASTVFWADASRAETAAEAEGLFAAMLGANRVDEGAEARKIRTILERISAGRPLAEVRPDLPVGVRFHVLGLSPNAARLSVRFWLEDDFGKIARRYLSHAEAMRIDPPPKDNSPSLWRLLIELAPQRKTENVPPKLAGDWLRSILTGSFYPLTLMAMLLMRLRADKDVNALRVGMIKAVLVRNFEVEVPVSLDSQNRDPGYLLGRLFAAYEYAQTQALGGSVNATIRDQYYGTASATPRAVFPLLQRKATHHLARLRKDRPQRARWLDEQIGQIFELADPDKLFVPTLTAQRQAMFAVGYYHQKNGFYRRKDGGAADAAAEMEETAE